MRIYSKVPKIPIEIIAKLQGQGLEISNVTVAQEFLSKVSYFRFRGYLYPYFDQVLPSNTPRQFKPHSTFEKVQEIYCFDESLRKLIFGIFPEIEVALRTILDITISPIAQHGFWYLENSWFKSTETQKFNELLSKLEKKFKKSPEAYALHYRSQYFNRVSQQYKDLPPFWVISELATLGELKILLEILDENAPGFRGSSSVSIKSTILDKMSHQFGATHYRQLTNWIHVLLGLRNICAHHGRLWNRNLMAPKGVESLVSKAFVQVTGRKPTNNVYAAIVVLRIMCKNQSIHDGLKDGLLALFKKFPESFMNKGTMGIPPDWHDDQIWL